MVGIIQMMQDVLYELQNIFQTSILDYCKNCKV